MIIDIRPFEEFKVGALPESVNLPEGAAFDAEGELTPHAVEVFATRQGKIVVVVGGGSRDQNVTQAYAEKLLKANIPRVCTLHNGIDIFKPVSGVLVVPST